MSNTAKRITKQTRLKALKHFIATRPKWALRALVVVYSRQTADEQVSQVTRYHNSEGFTGCDATFLSSLAQQYQNRGFLTEKQMSFLFRSMPKYARQLLRVCKEEELDAIINKQFLQNAERV